LVYIEYIKNGDFMKNFSEWLGNNDNKKFVMKNEAATTTDSPSPDHVAMMAKLDRIEREVSFTRSFLQDFETGLFHYLEDEKSRNVKFIRGDGDKTNKRSVSFKPDFGAKIWKAG
jgi:hypothetical protein